MDIVRALDCYLAHLLIPLQSKHDTLLSLSSLNNYRTIYLLTSAALLLHPPNFEFIFFNDGDVCTRLIL